MIDNSTESCYDAESEAERICPVCEHWFFEGQMVFLRQNAHGDLLEEPQLHCRECALSILRQQVEEVRAKCLHAGERPDLAEILASGKGRQ